ncbi:MAG: hypothetical protein QW267_03410 [Sulfolobales archaeon]
MVVDPLVDILYKLPNSALIAIVGNPYTYTFHVGIELLKRRYLNYNWYIIVDGSAQRYGDILKSYGVVKDNMVFVDELSEGLITLEKLLKEDNNLIYTVLDGNPSYIEDYRKVLMRRDPSVRSVVTIQVDEEHYKPIAYNADLIVRLRVVEDSSSLKTISRLVKLILVRGGVAELLLSYEVLSNGVIFKEFTWV